MTDRQRLLELALKGLESERSKIDGEIAQIKQQLHSQRNGIAGEVSANAPRKRRTMSAEARRRISEGMKRRYAELKKAAARK